MLKFIMLIHNHQPIGNFDDVFEKSFRNAYKPFLDIFSEFDLKISLHISGPLFDWLTINHPEYIDQVKRLVRSGRVEIIGSGYYEPVLAAIPERDAIAQLALYKKTLEKAFDTKVMGSWLTERVWEPHLPRIFKSGGYDYVITDDYHFLRSGFFVDELDGYFLTDYDNHVIAIYPGSETLRYIMPFSTMDKIYSYFHDAHERGVKTLIFADDGEKFGIWPETFKWVYEEKWLINFFKFLTDSKDWIETQLLSEHFISQRPKGCCYLPTTSYPELGEWALPTKSSILYKRNLDYLKNLPNFGEIKPFYQGGQWKNFLSKYRESRMMYRKMHYISERLQNKTLKDKMDLFRGQCNDAYWHGIFGGLYLPHLRREVNSNLIKAIKMISKKRFFDTFDFDLDGTDELIIKNDKLSIILSPSDGGTITNIDLLGKNINVTDTLTRRIEPYHLKLKEAQKGDNGTKTIHEQFKTKEDGLEQFLIYDCYEKTSLRCHLFDKFPESVDSISMAADKLSDISINNYEWEYKREGKNDKIRLYRKISDVSSCSKDITIDGNMLNVELKIKTSNSFQYAGVEWNFNLFAPDTPDRHFLVNNDIKRTINTGELFYDVEKLSLIDEWYGIRIEFALDAFVDLIVSPIYTVSLSEGGVERTFQGSTFLFISPLVDGFFNSTIKIKVASL